MSRCINDQIQMIEAILDGRLLIKNRRISEIEHDCFELKLNFRTFERLRTRDISSDNLRRLVAQQNGE